MCFLGDKHLSESRVRFAKFETHFAFEKYLNEPNGYQCSTNY